MSKCRNPQSKLPPKAHARGPESDVEMTGQTLECRGEASLLEVEAGRMTLDGGTDIWLQDEIQRTFKSCPLGQES